MKCNGDLSGIFSFKETLWWEDTLRRKFKAIQISHTGDRKFGTGTD